MLISYWSSDVCSSDLFVIGAEAERDPFRSRTRGPADAVDILLGHVRQFEVHDMAYGVDVAAARRDVGGHKHLDPARLELGTPLFALRLALVAGEGRGRVAHRAHRHSPPLHQTLGRV